MELRDPELFERKIYAKQFQAGAFRAEVRRLKPGDTVWIGTATDPYQPAERRFQITRQILEVFAEERGLDFGITTKSDLVARDAALMARIARKNRIRVHLTITTLDERSGPPAGAARAAPRAAFSRGREADRSRRARERAGASGDAADQRQ